MKKQKSAPVSNRFSKKRMDADRNESFQITRVQSASPTPRKSQSKMKSKPTYTPNKGGTKWSEYKHTNACKDEEENCHPYTVDRFTVCKQHDKECEKFCVNCNIAICLECICAAHKEHFLINIRQQAGCRIKELNEIHGTLLDISTKVELELDDIKTNGEKKLRDYIEGINRRIAINAEELRMEQTKSYDECLEAIKEQEMDLIRQVSKVEEKYELSMHKAFVMINEYKLLIDKKLDYVRYLIKDSPFIEVTKETCIQVRLDVAHLDVPELPPWKEMCFEEDGILKKGMDVPRIIATFNDQGRGGIQGPNNFLLNSDFCTNGIPNDICCTHISVIVATNSELAEFTVNKNNFVCEKFPLYNAAPIISVTCTRDGTGIYFVALHCNVWRLFRIVLRRPAVFVGEFANVKAVNCIHSTGDIQVIGVLKGEKRYTLSQWTPGCTKLESKDRIPDAVNICNSKCMWIAYHNVMRISLISDNHSVWLIGKMNQKTIFKKIDGYSYPRGVCEFPSGFLLVEAGHNRVVKVNEFGMRECICIEDKLCAPLVISYNDKSERLYVGLCGTKMPVRIYLPPGRVPCHLRDTDDCPKPKDVGNCNNGSNNNNNNNNNNKNNDCGNKGSGYLNMFNTTSDILYEYIEDDFYLKANEECFKNEKNNSDYK